MSICHLYNKQFTSNHTEEILGSFENSISLDINTIDTVDNYDAYIIELEETDNTISSKLRAIFKHKSNPLIYFIVPQKYNLMFFQLSYLLGAKDLITQGIETKKFIQKIVEDKKSHKREHFELLVGHANIKTQSFMIYRDMKLVYTSAKLLEKFESENFESFQKNILHKLDIKSLLNQDGMNENFISPDTTMSKKYIATTVSVTDNEKVIFIKPRPQEENKLDFISSRVTFIELLKERLIQRDIIYNELSAITLNIQNIKSLQKELNILDLENLLIDLLNFVESILERQVIFAQIELDFYVILFENISYEEINIRAKNFNTKTINYIATQKYKPLIDIHTFNLNSLDFSEIISTFNNIKNQDMKLEEPNSISIKHITDKQGVITEKSLLNDAFKHSAKIKILNIYHGLVINTPSKILKVTKDSIYISFESLQGVVINIEKRTILQSPIFLQDIEATVKKIDLTRKIVMLENFKFLKTNANSRKYSRVTTSTKTPVSILFNGTTINGQILDLSIKSIAIKTKYTQNIDTIKTQDVSLAFNIPNLKSNDGFSRLKINAKVIVISMTGTHDSCKIICDIDENHMNDSLLMQYIYERQKELIIELKKTAQLH